MTAYDLSGALRRIRELERELAEAKRVLALSEANELRLSTKLARSEARCSRLEKALKWYAAGQRWLPLTEEPTGDGIHSILGPSSVELDNGQTARAALAPDGGDK